MKTALFEPETIAVYASFIVVFRVVFLGGVSLPSVLRYGGLSGSRLAQIYSFEDAKGAGSVSDNFHLSQCICVYMSCPSVIGKMRNKEQVSHYKMRM